MERLFDWVERWTGRIILAPLVVVFAWTLVVSVWLAAQDGKWTLAYEYGGQVGDFFGGIVNPVIAFLALVWLAKGVQMQKQELLETRAALQEAATAQTTQVVHSAAMLQINALTALVESLNSEYTELTRAIEEQKELWRKSPSSRTEKRITELEIERKTVRDRREGYVARLINYLEPTVATEE